MDRAAARAFRITLESKQRPNGAHVDGTQQGCDVFAHFLGPGSPVLRM